MRPMSAVSSRAMRAATSPRPMARPLMPRTRLSTFARSIGAVTVSSAGPIDGATGSLGTLRSLDRAWSSSRSMERPYPTSVATAGLLRRPCLSGGWARSMGPHLDDLLAQRLDAVQAPPSCPHPPPDSRWPPALPRGSGGGPCLIASAERVGTRRSLPSPRLRGRARDRRERRRGWGPGSGRRVRRGTPCSGRSAAECDESPGRERPQGD